MIPYKNGKLIKNLFFRKNFAVQPDREKTNIKQKFKNNKILPQEKMNFSPKIKKRK